MSQLCSYCLWPSSSMFLCQGLSCWSTVCDQLGETKDKLSPPSLPLTLWFWLQSGWHHYLALHHPPHQWRGKGKEGGQRGGIEKGERGRVDVWEEKKGKKKTGIFVGEQVNLLDQQRRGRRAEPRTEGAAGASRSGGKGTKKKLFPAHFLSHSFCSLSPALSLLWSPCCAPFSPPLILSIPPSSPSSSSSCLPSHRRLLLPLLL